MSPRAHAPAPPDPDREHDELLRALLVERYRLTPARTRDRSAPDDAVPEPVRPEGAEPPGRSSGRRQRST